MHHVHTKRVASGKLDVEFNHWCYETCAAEHSRCAQRCVSSQPLVLLSDMGTDLKALLLPTTKPSCKCAFLSSTCSSVRWVPPNQSPHSAGSHETVKGMLPCHFNTGLCSLAKKNWAEKEGGIADLRHFFCMFTEKAYWCYLKRNQCCPLKHLHSVRSSGAIASKREIGFN